LKYDVITPPAEEPVTLDELKTQCNIFHDRLDAKLTSLGKAARELVEIETARCLVDTTIKVRLDYFDAYTIKLPIAYAKSVTSIFYRPGAGDELVEYTGFQFSRGEPGRIRPPYAGWFPWTFATLDGVEITCVCGYGAKEDVPEGLKQAILLLVSHWNENREAVTFGPGTELPIGVERLLNLYRWQGMGGAA